MTREEAQAVLDKHGYHYQGTRHIEEPARSEIKAALMVLHTEEPCQPLVRRVGMSDAEWAAIVAADRERTAQARKQPKPEPAVTVRSGRQS
jgi:hypothetical protein